MPGLVFLQYLCTTADHTRMDIRYKDFKYKELRIDADLQQEEIAKILKVKRNTYSKWENYINDMPLEKANDLANFYKVNIDYLFGLTKNRIDILGTLKLDYSVLAPRLLELRKEYNISQSELCKKLGLSQRLYSYYETGKRIPKTLKLLVIAQFYNVSVDYLVGRQDSKNII